MAEMGKKIRTVVTGADIDVADETNNNEESMIGGVGEKLAEVGAKIKKTVQKSPESEDDEVSAQIDNYLNEKSEQIIREWELATQTDISNVGQKTTQLSNELGILDNNLNEYYESTDKKIKKIEERLDNLEHSDK